jgi:hypothetical protein
VIRKDHLIPSELKRKKNVITFSVMALFCYPPAVTTVVVVLGFV